jgi:succinate-semialdehyde dehydrogenase/glutarate-semialdehyde dehydrogenase
MISAPFIKQQAYIDGKWVGGAASFPVANPATGEEIARVPDLGAAETKLAIEASARAFPAWSKSLARERATVLRRWYDLIAENADALAELLTREQGKPLAEAKGEILYGASYIEFYAGEALRIHGETVPSHRHDARLLVLKQPIGPVAAITPWNFPVAIIARKIAPVLAAGCTIVCKPAENTPLSALALAVLAEQAGIPAGVLNIVTTSHAKAVGEELTTHPAIRAVTFTGSTEVGKLLMRQAASTVKKVTLELGGNAPFVVFDDADLDEAVAGAMACKFRNGGQTCTSANRFFVQDRIYDEFARRLAAEAKELKVGNGLEAGVKQGPLITPAAVEKVKRHIADATQKGAEVLTGGKPHALGRTFFEPTVLIKATPAMLIAQEETFGPVAALIRFGFEDEVIRLANDTVFGLAAYVFTRDLGRAWRLAEAIESGIVVVNGDNYSNAAAPFGGVKQSGLGREGGRYGIEEFLEPKYVVMGGV